MKTRKNLERAIVLGLLLSTSIYGSVFAAAITVNDGTETDIANETSNITNGVYNKNYGSENIDVTGVGFLVAENGNPAVREFTLTTTGDFKVLKESINGAGGSGVRGAIDFYNVNYKIDGTITANNIYLTHTQDADDGGGIQGINLITKGDFEENPTLTLNATGNVSFENFDESIVLQKNTSLDINAGGDINFDINKSGSDWGRLDYTHGIVVHGGDNQVNGNKSDVHINLSAANINFNDLSTAIQFDGSNVDMNLIATDKIKIENIAGSKYAAIQYDNKNSYNESYLSNNKKTVANLVATNNISINNYKNGIIVTSDFPSFTVGSEINLYSNKIDITNTDVGINAASHNEVITGEDNVVILDDYKAYEAKDDFVRTNINTISANQKALSASEKAAIILNAATNKLMGAEKTVFAENGASITINGKYNNISNSEMGVNSIETLSDKETYALHAEGGNINVTSEDGMNKIISDGFRTVYAEGTKARRNKYDANVNIYGLTQIENKNYLNNNDNSKIAVVASGYDTASQGTVNIDLQGTTGNFIHGSVIAGQYGVVNINSNLPEGVSTLSRTGEVNKGSIAVYGNVMAGNNGELNLDLGEGGYLSGRVDDYQDAAVNGKHEEFFNPEFSNKITDSGIVNLTMGKGSTWDVTGQSWVTKLEGSGTIDMRNGGVNDTSHAVHIGELSGSHTFVMDLDVTNDHLLSDMLFIKDKASGEQKLWINSINGLEKLEDGDRLRFATVNDKSLTFSGDYTFGNYGNAKNGIMLMNNGVLNNAFIINSEKYVTDSDENLGYNGDTETESGFDAVKPGDVYVDNNYKDGTNWFLEKYSAGDEESDTAKTIVNMSKVNYNNAIYMDRLNKRLGEARYINPEEEQGMWVRIRHDRIGKDDAFRSQNTMYEMGYDEKQDCDNGERRIGFAVDYMDGKAEYTNISGSGDVKRYGLWLYDTWLGDKGHYTDYVLKWGHLENDFDIYTMNKRENVTGDFSNNVFSVSAEYGKKNDMGSGWYFEPQAQLQLARVTGADYTTSQGSKVSLDGINSLIGRAGFRLGRDLGERSTVYVKADVLHEFLGDQDVMAMDKTTGGEWTRIGEDYENEGTWYDVGFGFATALSDSSYAFMDFEKSFGNDNDETYQINAGVQWTF